MSAESLGAGPGRPGGSSLPDRLTLEVPTHGASRIIPSTLVVGVLADFSGQPEPALPELSRRPFVEIDRDNFDDVLARCRPRLAESVDDPIRGDGSRIDLDLRFDRLDDFNPEAVAGRIEALRPLLETRRRLLDLDRRGGSRDQVAAVLQELPASIEEKPLRAEGSLGQSAPSAQPGPDRGDARILEEILGLQAGTLPQAREEAAGGASGRLLEETVAQAMAGVPTVSRDACQTIAEGLARIDTLLSKGLSRVLQHASFQRLEAAWRGLHDLVFNTQTDATLKIRVLNLGKPELIRELERAGTFDRSELFRKLDRAAEDGEPIGVLLGDFEFSPEPADLAALESMAEMAAATHAPFLTAAAPEFFGVREFPELDEAPNLVHRLESAEFDRWNAFRSSDPARFVGLCLPPILARLPYGPETRSVELFAFEEELREAGHRAYLWGNAVFALGRRLTDAFAREGSCDHIQGMETGGKVQRLPVHIVRVDDEPVITGPAAIALSQRRATELVRLGFIPLVSIRNTDEAAFLAVPSCHRSQQPIRIEVESR